MVIRFEKYLSRRLQREEYRKALVERILTWHRENPNGEAEDSMYLQHVRTGFPIDVLESIIAKIEQEQRAGGQ